MAPFRLTLAAPQLGPAVADLGVRARRRRAAAPRRRDGDGDGAAGGAAGRAAAGMGLWTGPLQIGLRVPWPHEPL